jgi:hypothetical protein
MCLRDGPLLRDRMCRLRDGPLLRDRMHLRDRPFLLGRGRPLLRLRVHLRDGCRALLRGRPLLRDWSLRRHRALTYSRLIGRPGFLALLHGGDNDRLAPLHLKRLGDYNRLRLAAIYRDKLSAVRAGGLAVLLLHG